MSYEYIVTKCLGGVALVTLNRPAKLNALSFGLVRALDEALTQLEEEDAIKAVILTGTDERAFSAGEEEARATWLTSARPRQGFKDFLSRKGQRA